MTGSELSSLLNVLIGGTFVALIGAVVAAIRKIKSGTIVDDDAVIARLDSDNVKVRKERDDAIEARDIAVAKYEAERRARWRVEDMAATWKRQLTDREIVPAPSQEPIREETDERP